VALPFELLLSDECCVNDVVSSTQHFDVHHSEAPGIDNAAIAAAVASSLGSGVRVYASRLCTMLVLVPLMLLLMLTISLHVYLCINVFYMHRVTSCALSGMKRRCGSSDASEFFAALVSAA